MGVRYYNKIYNLYFHDTDVIETWLPPIYPYYCDKYALINFFLYGYHEIRE